MPRKALNELKKRFKFMENGSATKFAHKLPINVADIRLASDLLQKNAIKGTVAFCPVRKEQYDADGRETCICGGAFHSPFVVK